MKQNYLLVIMFSLFVIKGNSQSNYSVVPVPFHQYSGTLTPLLTSDDYYSGVITLPFNFDFYGNSYNQVVISTNGYIDFRNSLANSNSPWAFTTTVPNASFPVKNSILGCYEDLYNSTGLGTLTTGSYGSAPNRKFVVYFNNQPHYSCNNTAVSSFQMILSETSNNIDVQIIDRQVCTTWNSGNGVIGLIDSSGTLGITAPGRNTGNWTAHNEAWRFYRPGYYAASSSYSFVRCDDDADGFQTFNLNVAATDLYPANPSAIVFYSSAIDAQAGINPIANPTTYSNFSNPQTLYAVNTSMNNATKQVVLSVIDCNVDADNDGVPTASEDINNDTNLAYDDTDNDGIPDYLDNDDDGDLVLTNLEYVFNKTATTLLDTDHDNKPNYLDNDDDGDGTLTFNEDYNNDGNPANDDTNSNGIADYLDSNVTTLGTQVNSFEKTISLYPNPTSNILNIENSTDSIISVVSIYSISGSLIKEVKSVINIESIPVSELQTGIYFVKLQVNDEVQNYKFVKK